MSKSPKHARSVFGGLVGGFPAVICREGSAGYLAQRSNAGAPPCRGSDAACFQALGLLPAWGERDVRRPAADHPPSLVCGCWHAVFVAPGDMPLSGTHRMRAMPGCSCG